MNGDHAQPPVEILTKLALLHHLRQILVGGGDHAHIDFNRPAAAHALNRLFAERAQQFHLRARIDLADLIEKKSAAIRQFKAADALFLRSGEGALLVPKQFALENLR